MMDVYTYKGDDVWEDSYGYWQTTEDEGITAWKLLPSGYKSNLKNDNER